MFKYGESIPGEVRTPFDLALSVSSLKRKSVLSEIGRASCREECRSRWSPYH